MSQQQAVTETAPSCLAPVEERENWRQQLAVTETAPRPYILCEGRGQCLEVVALSQQQVQLVHTVVIQMLEDQLESDYHTIFDIIHSLHESHKHVCYIVNYVQLWQVCIVAVLTFGYSSKSTHVIWLIATESFAVEYIDMKHQPCRFG